jgi:hypothetical protein
LARTTAKRARRALSVFDGGEARIAEMVNVGPGVERRAHDSGQPFIGDCFFQFHSPLAIVRAPPHGAVCDGQDRPLTPA